MNYDFRQRIAADPAVATLGYRQVSVPGAVTTALDWEVHPQGLTDLLLRMAKEFGAGRPQLPPPCSAMSRA